MRSADWTPRDSRDFAESRLTVTITLKEYRELVSKAALYDAMCASERSEKAQPLPSQVEGATDDDASGD